MVPGRPENLMEFSAPNGVKKTEYLVVRCVCLRSVTVNGISEGVDDVCITVEAVDEVVPLVVAVVLLLLVVLVVLGNTSS